MSLTPEEIKQVNEYYFKEQKEKLEAYNKRLESLGPKERLFERVEFELNDAFEETRTPMELRVMSQRYAKTAKKLFGEFNIFLNQFLLEKNMMVIQAPKRRARFVISEAQLTQLGVAPGTLEYIQYLNMLDKKHIKE